MWKRIVIPIFTVVGGVVVVLWAWNQWGPSGG